MKKQISISINLCQGCGVFSFFSINEHDTGCMQQQQSFSDGESNVRKVLWVKKKKTGQILAKVMRNRYTYLLNFTVQHIHNTFTGLIIAVIKRAYELQFLF